MRFSPLIALLMRRWAGVLAALLLCSALLPAAPTQAARPATGGGGPPAALLPPGGSPADPQPAPRQLAPGARYFAETGHLLAGGFGDYWASQNGETVWGLPLTDEFTEHYSDGTSARVQYFERGVLEYDGSAPPGHQITPRAVGRLLLAGQQFSPPSGGFTVSGEFGRFWRNLGGAAIFGNPLSPPVSEGGRTVQYFERARFELHPEFVSTPYLVALTPAGYVALQAEGYGLPLGALVQLEPPTLAEGHTLLLRVARPPDGDVRGQLDGVPLAFVRAATTTLAGQPLLESHAVAGVTALGGIGTHRLTLTISDGHGGSRTVSRTLRVIGWNYPTTRIALADETAALLDPALVNSEDTTLNAIFAGRGTRPLWSGPFQLPLRGSIQITAPFGQRRAYNDGPISTFHPGVDLAVPLGTAVLAAAPGRVVFAQRLPERGNCIIVDHGLGVYTLYAHLSAFRFAAGATVRAGQVLGLAGSTGFSTGPHLHWEVHVAGPAVDPFEWTRRSLP